MARVSKVDECMICGETPCGCRRGKPNLTKPAEPVVEEIRTPIKLEIPRLRPTPRVEVRARPAHMVVADEELVLIAALRNVESIMCDAERERFKSQLMSAVTNEERVAFWKARRDEEVRK